MKLSSWNGEWKSFRVTRTVWPLATAKQAGKMCRVPVSNPCYMCIHGWLSTCRYNCRIISQKHVRQDGLSVNHRSGWFSPGKDNRATAVSNHIFYTSYLNQTMRREFNRSKSVPHLILALLSGPKSHSWDMKSDSPVFSWIATRSSTNTFSLGFVNTASIINLEKKCGMELWKLFWECHFSSVFKILSH